MRPFFYITNSATWIIHIDFLELGHTVIRDLSIYSFPSHCSNFFCDAQSSLEQFVQMRRYMRCQLIANGINTFEQEREQDQYVQILWDSEPCSQQIIPCSQQIIYKCTSKWKPPPPYPLWAGRCSKSRVKGHKELKISSKSLKFPPGYYISLRRNCLPVHFVRSVGCLAVHRVNKRR